MRLHGCDVPSDLPMMEMQKCPAIRAALDKLGHRLGDRSFQVMDHWDADRLAVGIARPDDPAHLVYICCDGDTAKVFTVVLERKAGTDAEVPYLECGRFDGLDLEALELVVARHLGAD